MRNVFSPKQMAEADKATVAGGVASEDLMERAGSAVAGVCLGIIQGAYGKRILIVAGKGNNAGDGFVAARYLASRGARPILALLGDEEELHGDSLANFLRFDGRKLVGPDPSVLRTEMRRSDLIVDAIVGTGLRGSLDPRLAEVVEMLNAAGKPIVAVDIPSGVDGLTGEVQGHAVRATATVTMAALKPGLLLGEGPEHAGQVEIVDIGLDLGRFDPELRLVEAGDIAAVLPQRPPDSDKRSVGTVLVIAGSEGMTGAAALVSRGALRCGAGLVTVGSVEAVAKAVSASLAEAMTVSVPATQSGSISVDGLSALLERASKVTAVAIGPGLSRDPETEELVRKAVLEISVPLVLDADGLNAFEKDAEALRGRPSATVLTPHERELGRLMGIDDAALLKDRPEAARQASRSTGAVVLLKGRRTVIAEPSGHVWVIPVGGPVLATGGTGDVLTGMIAALLAGGVDAPAAAWAGAYLHGKTGDLLAEMRGDRGILAGDVAEMLPDVIGLVRSGR